ncbi:MAG: sigma-70 family RNA polymerase sigma factor [Actinomycetota bacterium]|nr:sigma-70 family RNA polymerase sigma factor [Actinomycetota bacterium]
MSDSTDLLAHWPAMVGVAHAVLGSVDDAEECAAAALVQVLAQAPANVQNHEAYLVTVAKRRAFDMRRAQHRAQRRDARLALLDDRTVADLAEDVVAKAEAAWADATAQRLLSPRVYRLLQLVGEGVPTSQIAAELGLTDRAVESHLMRARRTMRSALARAVALLGLLGAGLRRSLGPAAPLTVAAAAILMITLPSIAPGDRGDVSAPTDAGLLRPPHAFESWVAPGHAVATATVSATGGRASAVSASAQPSRATVASVQGPAHAGVWR